MLRIGVTGGIGSGKSTVCRILEVLGVPVFHADDEGKRLLQDDAEVKKQLLATFGEAILSQGVLDRKALAHVVFHDPIALAKLNAIVHPAVREAFRSFCTEHGHAPYVVMEAAILAETGGHAAMDHLVVVTAPETERVKRVMERDEMGEEEVRARLRNQTNDDTRVKLADTVIVNDGQTMVIPQVLALHERLTATT